MSSSPQKAFCSLWWSNDGSLSHQINHGKNDGRALSPGERRKIPHWYCSYSVKSCKMNGDHLNPKNHIKYSLALADSRQDLSVCYFTPRWSIFC